MMYGLTMIKDYLDEILDGDKTFDARSYPTNKRGTIVLVSSSNMAIYGLIDLVGVHLISKEEYCSWHTTGRFKGLKFEAEDGVYYAYDFANPRRLAKPIKANVAKKTWIELDDSISSKFYFENRLF